MRQYVAITPNTKIINNNNGVLKCLNEDTFIPWDSYYFAKVLDTAFEHVVEYIEESMGCEYTHKSNFIYTDLIDSRNNELATEILTELKKEILKRYEC